MIRHLALAYTLVVVASITVACSSDIDAAPAPAGWVTTNGDGFSLAHPAGWVDQTDVPDRARTLLSVLPTGDLTGGFVRVSVSLVDGTDVDTAAAAMMSLVTGLTDRNSVTEVSDRRGFENEAGQPTQTWSLDVDDTSTGETIEYRTDLMAVEGDRVLTLQISQPRASYDPGLVAEIQRAFVVR